MPTARKTMRATKGRRQTTTTSVRAGARLVRWRRAAVRSIVASRRATLRLVSPLPEEEILRSRTQDRWSVKDVLAHLLGCDEETVHRLKLIASGRADRIHWFESMADADRFNARSVARHRRLGLRALLRRRERAQDKLVDVLERLPPDALDDRSHAYTVVDWLPAPGWSHEQEHVAAIRAWWRSRRPVVIGPPARRRTPSRIPRRAR